MTGEVLPVPGQGFSRAGGDDEDSPRPNADQVPRYSFQLSPLVPVEE